MRIAKWLNIIWTIRPRTPNYSMIPGYSFISEMTLPSTISYIYTRITHMLKKDLQKIGLSEKGSKVYLAILELGETNIERIAEKSGIKRTTVYDVIEELKNEGLVSIVKKNKKNFYCIEDPRMMGAKLAEKKLILDNIMPKLMSMTNLIDRKPKVKYYEGIEGIKTIYSDILKYPNNEYLFWVTRDVWDVLGEKYLNSFMQNRVKNKMCARAIDSIDRNVDPASIPEKGLRETRYICSDEYPLDVNIELYGGYKVAILAYKDQTGLVIENKRIYATLRSIFEMCWDVAQKNKGIT